ncbi:MAG: hypothetical protein WA996_19365, partial [Candidatus Promineifilaceae bacterium]
SAAAVDYDRRVFVSRPLSSSFHKLFQRDVDVVGGIDDAVGVGEVSTGSGLQSLRSNVSIKVQVETSMRYLVFLRLFRLN